MHARMCFSILEGIVSQIDQYKDSIYITSNTKNSLQIRHINLKRFGDWAFPDNIKAADSVQNLKTQLKTLLFRKELI